MGERAACAAKPGAESSVKADFSCRFHGKIGAEKDFLGLPAMLVFPALNWGA